MTKFYLILLPIPFPADFLGVGVCVGARILISPMLCLGGYCPSDAGPLN